MLRRERENDQTWSAVEDRVESEGREKTEKASLDALDWSDENQLIEENEFETKNARSRINRIKIKRHENRTSQRATKDAPTLQETHMRNLVQHHSDAWYRSVSPWRGAGGSDRGKDRMSAGNVERCIGHGHT